ncbi:unnamed protein product [Arabis nemorensis]|uniref:Uncharacterized protein n=1 Tax=Arabis nemorensis TaxID=586526 RepID=A0A565AL18_9BRAS|nr:unnamed protein product [Arabis nemorensis]
MKRNGSGPSLSSLIKSLDDAMRSKKRIDSRSRPVGMWITGIKRPLLQNFGAILKPRILLLQAIKKLVRERKEAIFAKGKIYMCFKFPSRIRLWMIEADVKFLEGEVAKNVDAYLKLARELQPHLFPYTNNKCFEAKNITSAEMELLRLEWNQGNKFTEDGDGDGGDLA